ncbi:mechanosensitive ion channel protein [Anaerobacillus alkalidiazotrophicus]|uniref:Mechanosensitive ion channel protein n=1 Tax=Anaerobacillus alkalidiazotrophicus TaxID=472963 RepID=A0A1S2M1V5_9BACI|nr:mechanosensitive ion channel family protein [Anaerobacillus alkalidiazotrophicus]OIJ18722.1 mechanosensitive ion channel protein [Anaerobacillus alkalidiazotrophicus]
MFEEYSHLLGWLIQWEDIGIAIGIFILFHVFRKVFTKYIFKLLLRFAKKTPTELLTNIFVAFESPVRLFFVGLGTYLSLKYLPLTQQTDAFILQMYRSFNIFLIGYGLFNLSASSSVLFQKISEKIDLEVDEILLPFLSKIVRVIIIALIISVIAGEWDYDVNGFVAGLGLGGLAFALAAKDAIANLFGGVVIITEKPFSIGDWIKTPSVEGTVEDITFRSTKVRTFSQAIVTVPNSVLSNEPITNWTKMGKRRVSFHLGVTYSTPKEKLELVIRNIEELLKNHTEVDQETIFVKFDVFNDSSLDIFIYFFTKTTVWGEFLAVKEDINLKIMEILEGDGVSVAFPSRSIYIEANERNTE